MNKLRLLLSASALLTCLPLKAGTQYSVVGNATSSGADSARGPLHFSSPYLFGASQNGGANGFGTIFRFNITTGMYEITHSFTGGAGGANPGSGLTWVNGNSRLYGVTYGGANQQGTLFSIDLPGNFFETRRQFASASGGLPDCAPIRAADGKLYGVTGSGGASGFGGIYQCNLDGTGYSLIHEFSGTTGMKRGKGAAIGGLVEGTSGVLYACAPSGGNTTDTGLFFEAFTNGVTFNFRRAFDAPGFTKPSNRLLLASDGYFYGTAVEGGAANRGGIFRVIPNVEYSELHHFTDSPDGYGVYSQLTEGSDGRIYGCAFFSSTNNGSVFRMSKDGRNFAVLHRFTGGPGDGAQPDSPLVEVSGGVFYGTTTNGGTNGAGTVFRIETTLEAPKVKVLGRSRPLIRGKSLRLRGTASDDLGVKKVEWAAKGAYKPAKGTAAWNARIPVKPSVRRLTVRVRSTDADGLVSPVKTVRARRAI